MEIHGFEDTTGDVHSMYTPDSHDSVTDTGTDDFGHDAGYVPGDTAGSERAETIELDVNGRSTDVTATVDTDHDGRADTALIDSGDGNKVAITDTDHDGTADHALLIDDQGRVIDSAAFDQSTGEWHDDGGAATSSTDSTASDGATTDTTTPSSSTTGSTEQIELDADGRSVRLDTTVDTDHDGRGDTAIVDSGDGSRVAITDTDHDGKADEAALVDSSGHVVDTAHIDPRTGEWVQGSDSHTPYGVGEAFPGADGATTTAGTGTTDGSTSTSAGSEPTAATTTADSGPSHGEDRQITVEAAGRSSEINATVDVDHDGVNDTAVVQGPDGSQVAFSDTDGDGEADRAAVFDSQGNLVGTAHYDPSTGDWTDDPR